MRFLLARLAAALLVCLGPVPAHAEWHRASSAHFVIYADENPQRLRDFAIRLERFDFAARALLNMEDLPPSKGNRLTIFVLRDEKEVRRLAGDMTGFTSGFYRGLAGGSVAFIPRKVQGGDEDDVNLILLHEYAHHLMFQDLRSAYPEWLIEGFAEFLATAKFERNGAVGLGLPAAHRAYGLLNGKPLPLEALLSGNYQKVTNDQRESVYGRGWLLTHYFFMEPSRKGQLTAYLTAISNGVSPIEAARQAFGDFKKLERDLDQYLRRSRLVYREVKPANVTVPAVEITRLGAGAAEVLPLLAELRNDVSLKAAKSLAEKIRAIAARFPGDLLVQTTLAEAELNAGNGQAAEAAADRALAVNPQSTDAMILKGRAMMEIATDSADADEKRFAEARKWFTRANKLDPEDPEPLVEFYKSFLLSGTRPNANAIAALHYAADLAPQDPNVRINSALQYVRDGKLKEARARLLPVAFDPHGGEGAATARAVIAKIDAGDAKAAEKAAEEGL